MAALEGGARGLAFASGLAALDAALQPVRRRARGSLVTEDLYGGTFRLLERVYRARGLEVAYVDTSDGAAVDAALAKGVAGVLAREPHEPAAAASATWPRSPPRRTEQGAAGDRRQHLPDAVPPAAARARRGRRRAQRAASTWAATTTSWRGWPWRATRSWPSGWPSTRTRSAASSARRTRGCCCAGLKTLAVRLERQQQSAQASRSGCRGDPQRAARLLPRPARRPRPRAARAGRVAASARWSRSRSTSRRGSRRCSRTCSVFLFAESLGGVESLVTYPGRADPRRHRPGHPRAARASTTACCGSRSASSTSTT